MMKRSKFDEEYVNDLPEAIIHQILSKLPAAENGTITKQIAKLSLISKGWLTACSSYQVIDLISTCSYGTPQDVKKTQQLIRYLDKTITNYPPYNTIHKLRLHLDFKIFLDDLAGKIIPDHLSYTNALPPLLDKWINTALDKRVRHLDLQIRFRCMDKGVEQKFGSAEHYEAVSKNHESFIWRYHIPMRVLSSDFVKSLKLGWQVCPPRSLISSSGDDDDDDIRNMDLQQQQLPLSLRRSCSSLRSLELFNVNKDVDNKAFERLIQACPFIEELIIDSEYINEIKVFSLQRVKKISIRRYILDSAGGFKRAGDFYIKIEAPSLETLCLLDLGRGGEERKGYYTAILDVDCCNLKCLKLIRDLTMDDGKLDSFVSKFPMLESLELEDCSLIKEINIRNPVMKKIELKFGNLWSGFSRVEISSPNVLHFRYECTSGKKFPSIWVSEDNCPRYVEAVFKNNQPISLFSCWFRKLRESMIRLNSNHTSLSFNYTWKKERGEEKELVPTKLAACKIDNLNLNVTGPCSSFLVILNRLLSTFHPTTLRASLVDDTNGQGHAFLQFLCENLANRGNNTTPCSSCSIHYKCWKHQLKEVKLEGVKGSYGGRRYLNWETMGKLLPTLAIDHHHICFKLEWVK